MNKYYKIFLYSLFLLCLPLPSLAQYDLNDNGSNEFIFTSADKDGVLHWYAQDPYTDELLSLNTFGFTSYKTSFGFWLNDYLPAKAYLRKGTNGAVYFAAEGAKEELPLGLSKDKSYSILGRNINSTHTTDVALINGKRKKWAWKFAFEPFTDNIELQRLLFGKKNEFPFLLKTRGNTDSICALRVNKKRKDFISCRRLNARRKKRIILKGFNAPKQVPEVLKQENGREIIVFIESVTNAG